MPGPMLSHFNARKRKKIFKKIVDKLSFICYTNIRKGKGIPNMSKKKKELGATLDAYLKIRKEWGINPVTRVIKDKKK